MAKKLFFLFFIVAFVYAFVMDKYFPNLFQDGSKYILFFPFLLGVSSICLGKCEIDQGYVSTTRVRFYRDKNPIVYWGCTGLTFLTGILLLGVSVVKLIVE